MNRYVCVVYYNGISDSFAAQVTVYPVQSLTTPSDEKPKVLGAEFPCEIDSEKAKAAAWEALPQLLKDAIAAIEVLPVVDGHPS